MIAGTGAEHYRFVPVLALFVLVKTAAKRRRGLGTMSPSRFGIGVTRPLCGIQRDGNRKSQGVLARLCEFPGSAAQRLSCFANLPYIKKISPDKMPKLIRMVEKIKL